jgi:sugar/nucleoside kinase (ribokinase family)
MTQPQIVVAGHICLDLIPQLDLRHGDLRSALEPGRLLEIGPALATTGGAVANVGLALHRLGVPVRLMGKIGDDPLGSALQTVLQRQGRALSNDMIITHGESTSYTVVLSPPQMDRIFLHHPGANATFGAADVPYSKLDGIKLFHLGYPPLMRRLYENDGYELGVLYSMVKSRGVLTSLDMSLPDIDSPAGKIDWPKLLQRVLPYVDIFCPSLDEILFMLGRPRVDKPDVALLREVSQVLLGWGAGVVLVKMGEWGLWAAVNKEDARLHVFDKFAPSLRSTWCGQTAYMPIFQVVVEGTTGAGDSTIAGFLSQIIRDVPLEEALTFAAAVGAFCCEGPDATSGIPSRQMVEARLRTKWPRRKGLQSTL